MNYCLKQKVFRALKLSALLIVPAINMSNATGMNTIPIAQEYLQQSFKVTGIITDAQGEPVIGATIVEKGTTNGGVSDLNGVFEIETKHKDAVLTISYLGYATQDVKIQGSGRLTIVLKEDSKNLEEVVVTALGIKREEKALGYAVQKISGDDMLVAKSVDITSSLTGKIAGLSIQNNTEFDTNAAIYLRGEKPIIIVDGVPFASITINEIAADDIESIDVLKGATASALYGARGANGAIMITTKKGAKKEGLNVSVNSNTMFFAGYLAFPETQHSYSAGTNGKYNNNGVWGDKLDIGRTAVQWDPYTYECHEMELTSKGKDNFKNFLEPGFVTNNNVNVTQKGKYGSFRTSLTHVYNKGEYPNQKLNKVTFNVGGEMKYNKFSMDASISYNKRKTSNTGGHGYGGSYIYDMVIWGGTEYDIRDYRNYWVAGKENKQQNWYDNLWYNNPYFKAYEKISRYDKDIINMALNSSYELTPWLKVMLRAGTDFYHKKNEDITPISYNGSEKRGYYGAKKETWFSINADAILMAEHTWNKLYVNGMVGGNIFYSNNDGASGNTQGGLTIPGYYSLKASRDPATTNSWIYQKRINSLYGKASLAWDNTYYLDVTARNDWSSTLRPDERSYFYPSVSGSVILSEIINLPSWWEFLKMRGSWTVTKKDTDIYANNNTYSVSTNIWEGLPTASYPKTLIGGNVLPQKAEVWEVGLASSFWGKRLTFDVAYYRKLDSDFIINGGVSQSTGYSYVQTNSEEERLRTGVEVMVGGTPIKTKYFEWNILTNWAHDRYIYNKLDPEYSNKKPWITEGADWDWLAIYDWERDSQGNIVLNGGLPVRQTFQTKVGRYTPDLVWGITNTLKYKNWTLNFTIDGRVGGVTYSKTEQMLWNSGNHIDTDNQYRYDEVVNRKIAYVGNGVKVVSGSVTRDPDGNIMEDTRVFAPNDVVVSYESFIKQYHSSHELPSRQNILSQTFFKLRNISLTYDVPSAFCRKLGLQVASIGVTGENLLLWTKEFKFADPEKGGETEELNSPSQRLLGFNVKFNF